MEVSVTTKKPDQSAADSSSTWGGPAAVSAAQASATLAGPVSRGYREEMEDFAYCVRTWDHKVGYKKGDDGKYVQRLPRCHGEVAMSDAIVALAANAAMRKGERISFKDEWFAGDSPALPDWDGLEKIDCKVDLKKA
jgi:hypothetical protein